uniref:CCHC-type domain-containing protein n=1 Tax=Meloidogyne hapla TaxID=6305 RepID=A0A1I8B1H5_MELHA
MDEKAFERLMKAQTEQFSQLFKEFCGNKSKVEDSVEKESADLYWKLQSLVGEFNADIETGVTFESWFDKNKSFFVVDGKSLAEEVKVRLLATKLGSVEYAKISQKLMPQKLESMKFESLVDELKKEFCDPRSKLVRRYEVMKLKCPCAEKVLDFGNVVNSECEKAEMALSVEEVKILIFIAGIPEEMNDLRQISLRFVERYSKPEECSLKILLEECRSYLAMKSEAKIFENSLSRFKVEPEYYADVNNVTTVEFDKGNFKGNRNSQNLENSRFNKSESQPWRREGQVKNYDSVQCYNCGLFGHISRYCRKPKKWSNQVNSPEVNQVRVNSSHSGPYCCTVRIPRQYSRNGSPSSQNKSQESMKSNSLKSKSSRVSHSKSNYSRKSSQFHEGIEVLVLNLNKKGKIIWMPGTILSKFGSKYKVEVPKLKTVVSRDEWHIRKPKSMQSCGSQSYSEKSIRTKVSSICSQNSRRSQILEISPIETCSQSKNGSEQKQLHAERDVEQTKDVETKKSWSYFMW